MTEIPPLNELEYAASRVPGKFWRLPADPETLKVDLDSIPRGRDRKSFRAVRKFYEAQNHLIDRFFEAEGILRALRPNSPPADSAQDDENSSNGNQPMPNSARRLRESAPSPSVRRAINLSFAANVFLFCVKVFAAVYSGSLSVIVSTIDSSLDLLSNFMVWATSRAVARRDREHYPVGKSRLEPLILIVFASIMGVSAFQLVIEGLTRIGEGSRPAKIDPVSYTVIGTTILVKLFLSIYCFTLRTLSDSVAALFQDHRNDVITNSFTLVALLLIGFYPNLWFLDPVTAIILGLLIVWTWALTGARHVLRLAGRTAPPSSVSAVLYLACNHYPPVTAVESVRAYYTGSKLVVELDVVLPGSVQLAVGHAIGEGIQRELEMLSDVERAFVHLDVDVAHGEAEEHLMV